MQSRPNVEQQVKRSEYVDVLKGLAIVLVLFGHAGQRSTQAIPDTAWASALFSFGHWHMALFIAVSGYLTFGRVPKDTGAWLAGKAGMLLVPYVAWSLVYYWVPDPFIAKYGSLLEYAKAVALYPANTFWFFYVLFLCYAGMALVSKLGDWSMVALGLATWAVPLNVLGLELLEWYWWWFCLGYLGARYREQLVRWRWAGWAFAAAAYPLLQWLWPAEAPLAARIAWGIVGLGASTAVAYALAKSPVRPQLAYLGRHTFELYPSEFLFFLIPLPMAFWRIPALTAVAVVGGLGLGAILRRFRPTSVIFLGNRAKANPDFVHSVTNNSSQIADTGNKGERQHAESSDDHNGRRWRAIRPGVRSRAYADRPSR